LLTRKHADAEAAVAAWNAQALPGAAVHYRPSPDDEPIRYATRSRAQLIAGRFPVIWLAGRTGCVPLTACELVGPPLPRAWAVQPAEVSA
jgi:hypothetical protein